MQENPRAKKGKFRPRLEVQEFPDRSVNMLKMKLLKLKRTEANKDPQVCLQWGFLNNL
jgi:hypothetical protein